MRTIRTEINALCLNGSVHLRRVFGGLLIARLSTFVTLSLHHFIMRSFSGEAQRFGFFSAA
jgi:hypothetical protein